MLCVTGNRIVGVELVERVSAGGVIIPDTVAGNDPSKAKCLRIKVTGVGPGLFASELGKRVSVSQELGVDLEPGMVLYTNRFTNVLKVDGAELRVFTPSDVIGVER